MPGLTELIFLLFKGTNLIIASLALVIGGILTWLVFANKTQRKKVKVLIYLWLIIILSAWFAMGICNYIVIWKTSFPTGTTGVLVLRIVGDENNSLQRDLVESLRNELGKTPFTNSIVVRASEDLLDDTRIDPSKAHQYARKIGKQFNAKIVVWGDRTGKGKFWPYVTIVNKTENQIMLGERAMAVQDISQLKLPQEIVYEPACLALFITGFSLYENDHYREALNYFESASQRTDQGSPDIAPIQFFIGNCQLLLVQSQVNPKQLILAAIKHFQSAANGFGETNSPENWASAQNGLGLALMNEGNWTMGEERQKLRTEEMNSYRAALKVINRKESPLSWAMIQMNLGNALANQDLVSDNDESSLLANSIDMFLESLKVATYDRYPEEWAIIQLNLGNILQEQATRGDGKDIPQLLAESVAASREALKVFTREKWPQYWAVVRNNLGLALAEQGVRAEGDEGPRLLAEAVTIDQEALKVISSDATPLLWGAVQMNLANILAEQGKRTGGEKGQQLLAEAVATYQNALNVFDREQSTQYWVMVQMDLANTLLEQGSRAGGENGQQLLVESVAAYHDALIVCTREQSPYGWATRQLLFGKH